MVPVCPSTAPLLLEVPTLGPSWRVLFDHRGRGGVRLSLPPTGTGGPPPRDLRLLALAASRRLGNAELVLVDGVVAWREGALTWLRLPAAPADVVLEERRDQAIVTRLPPAADPGTGRLVWTMLRRPAGEVAARAFRGRSKNDEVGFRGAIALTAALRRPLLVRLGSGSVIATRPAPRGVEVGGRVQPLAPTGQANSTSRPR